MFTSPDGNYSFGGLRDGRLSVSLQGYEPVDVTATPDGFDDVPLQRVVRVAAGDQAVSQTLAPNDVGYMVAPDSRCQPCRLIRVTSGTTGTVRVRVAWTD